MTFENYPDMPTNMKKIHTIKNSGIYSETNNSSEKNSDDINTVKKF